MTSRSVDDRPEGSWLGASDASTGIAANSSSPQREGSELIEHDMHGGYGLCPGTGRVWVDDGEQSNTYAQGACPNCARPKPTPSDRLQALEAENERLRGSVSSAERRVRPSGRTDAQSHLDWRPIESAPRDGDFLGWSDAHGVRVAYWAEWYDNLAQLSAEGWRGVTDLEQLPNLTHWMPLPPPPAENDASVAVAKQRDAGNPATDTLDPLSLAEAEVEPAHTPPNVREAVERMAADGAPVASPAFAGNPWATVRWADVQTLVQHHCGAKL